MVTVTGIDVLAYGTKLDVELHTIIPLTFHYYPHHLDKGGKRISFAGLLFPGYKRLSFLGTIFDVHFNPILPAKEMFSGTKKSPIIKSRSSVGLPQQSCKLTIV